MFLKDTSKYKIAVYHYNLTELTSTFIDPIYYSDKTIFHRSAHFIEDTGAFAYLDQMKQLQYNLKNIMVKLLKIILSQNLK